MKWIFQMCLIFTLGFNFKLLSAQDIEVGAAQINGYLGLIKDKNVAVVGNQSSMVNKTHLVDTLLTLGINIKKVFAPEHGFRGKADAGEKVSDDVDVKTGLPILSLYGSKNRKPSPDKLADVDVILFDIQDVGVRFYTYISTLNYVMEACAEQGKKIIVLDRPNPNGFYVDGPILKEGNKSFIGLHPVPIVHGMTIGEYAKMIKGEKWINKAEECELEVIPCKNYDHDSLYSLPVKPSPNLPNMASIYLYPSLCLFEGTNVSVGRGTDKPFQQFGSPYISPTNYSFVPQSNEGAKHPKHEGEKCFGYDVSQFGEEYLIGYKKLYLYWLVAMYEETPDKKTFFRKDGFFDLLTGDDSIREMIIEGKSADEIWESFQEEVKEFKLKRKKYLIYQDFE